MISNYFNVKSYPNPHSSAERRSNFFVVASFVVEDYGEIDLYSSCPGWCVLPEIISQFWIFRKSKTLEVANGRLYGSEVHGAVVVFE